MFCFSPGFESDFLSKEVILSQSKDLSGLSFWGWSHSSLMTIIYWQVVLFWSKQTSHQSSSVILFLWVRKLKFKATKLLNWIWIQVYLTQKTVTLTIVRNCLTILIPQTPELLKEILKIYTVILFLNFCMDILMHFEKFTQCIITT